MQCRVLTRGCGGRMISFCLGCSVSPQEEMPSGSFFYTSGFGSNVLDGRFKLGAVRVLMIIEKR